MLPLTPSHASYLLLVFSCIEKWHKTTEKCPTCNLKFKKNEIRPIFSKGIKCVDTAGTEAALKDLDVERTARQEAEKKEGHLRIQLNMKDAEIRNLMKQVHKLKSQRSSQAFNGAADGDDENAASASFASSALEPSAKFQLFKSVDLSKYGNCRIMEYDPRNVQLLISAENKTSTLFAQKGYGLVRVSMLELGKSKYIGIHKLQIRDVRKCPADDSSLVLTVSMDKTAKLTNVNSNSVVATFPLGRQAWCCCWNEDDPATFFCGLMNGDIVEFNTGNLQSSVRTIKGQSPRPLVALHHLSAVSGFQIRGLMACDVNNMSIWSVGQDGEYTCLSVTALVGGAATWATPHATSYLPTSRSTYCLLSRRPAKAAGARVTHSVYTLSPDADTGVDCTISKQIHSGPGQVNLSRSELLTDPGAADGLLVAEPHEQTSSVKVWDVGTGDELQSIVCQGEQPLDIRAFSSPAASSAQLAILTKNKVLLHMWK